MPEDIPNPNLSKQDIEIWKNQLERKILSETRWQNESIAAIADAATRIHSKPQIVKSDGLLMLLMGNLSLGVLLGGLGSWIDNTGVAIALTVVGCNLWTTFAIFYITDRLRGFYEATFNKPVIVERRGSEDRERLPLRGRERPVQGGIPSPSSGESGIPGGAVGGDLAGTPEDRERQTQGLKESPEKERPDPKPKKRPIPKKKKPKSVSKKKDKTKGGSNGKDNNGDNPKGN